MPDHGKRIVFVRRPVTKRSGNSVILGAPQLWIVNSDGTGARNLTRNSKWYEETPRFSPDGNRLAFKSNRGGGSSSIYLMNADGSGAKRLTDKAWGSEQIAPQWSASGRWIAYVGGNRRRKPKCYVMKADGTGQRLLAEMVRSFAWKR